MSEAATSLIKGMYESFGRGDIDGVIAGLTPDIHWRVNGERSDYPLFGVWNGTAEVKQFFAGVAELEQFSEFSPNEFYGPATGFSFSDDTQARSPRPAAPSRRNSSTFSRCAAARFATSTNSTILRVSSRRGAGERGG